MIDTKLKGPVHPRLKMIERKFLPDVFTLYYGRFHLSFQVWYAVHHHIALIS